MFSLVKWRLEERVFSIIAPSLAHMLYRNLPTQGSTRCECILMFFLSPWCSLCMNSFERKKSHFLEFCNKINNIMQVTLYQHKYYILYVVVLINKQASSILLITWLLYCKHVQFKHLLCSLHGVRSDQEFIILEASTSNSWSDIPYIIHLDNDITCMHMYVT